MSEATEQREIEKAASELEQPIWSVVSFDECEASGLTYANAVALLTQKESEEVYGLCIITDEAARRMVNGEW